MDTRREEGHGTKEAEIRVNVATSQEMPRIAGDGQKLQEAGKDPP